MNIKRAGEFKGFTWNCVWTHSALFIWWHWPVYFGNPLWCSGWTHEFPALPILSDHITRDTASLLSTTAQLGPLNRLQPYPEGKNRTAYYSLKHRRSSFKAIGPNVLISIQRHEWGRMPVHPADGGHDTATMHFSAGNKNQRLNQTWLGAIIIQTECIHSKRRSCLQDTIWSKRVWQEIHKWMAEWGPCASLKIHFLTRLPSLDRNGASLVKYRLNEITWKSTHWLANEQRSAGSLSLMRGNQSNSIIHLGEIGSSHFKSDYCTSSEIKKFSMTKLHVASPLCRLLSFTSRVNIFSRAPKYRKVTGVQHTGFGSFYIQTATNLLELNTVKLPKIWLTYLRLLCHGVSSLFLHLTFPTLQTTKRFYADRHLKPVTVTSSNTLQ